VSDSGVGKFRLIVCQGLQDHRQRKVSDGEDVADVGYTNC